jgi:hypothetical protein
MLQLQNRQAATVLQCDVRYMSKDDIQVTVEPLPTRSGWVAAFAACWLSAAVAGLFVLWSYENAPGVAAAAHEQWPAETALKLAADRPTLVFLAHPQCVCTRASVGELAEALARAGTKPKTYVVFLKPSSFADGWEKSGLWEAASALPDTTVLRDDDGREAMRFGAMTSGQTMLYDASGTLLFSGGITGARGHAGDNEGRSAVVSLLDHLETRHRTTNVFGCSLFSPAKS